MSKATIVVEGFVSKDPELRTAGGKQVVTVDIPHTPRKKDGDQWVDAGETIWFQAAFWERDAQPIVDLVRKGTLVTVTGFPELNVYQRSNGETGVSVRIKGGTLGVIPREARDGHGQPQGQRQQDEPWNPTSGRGRPEQRDVWSPQGGQFDDETPF